MEVMILEHIVRTFIAVITMMAIIFTAFKWYADLKEARLRQKINDANRDGKSYTDKHYAELKGSIKSVEKDVCTLNDRMDEFEKDKCKHL